MNFLALINELCSSYVTIYNGLAGSLKLWYILDFTLSLVVVPVGITNTFFDCSSVSMNASFFILRLDVDPESYIENGTLYSAHLHCILTSTCFLHILLFFLPILCNGSFHLNILPFPPFNTFYLLGYICYWFTLSSKQGPVVITFGIWIRL